MFNLLTSLNNCKVINNIVALDVNCSYPMCVLWYWTFHVIW